MATNQLSVLTEPDEEVEAPATTSERSGRMARLGAWSATHLRAVLLLWLIVLIIFGAFAPQVEHALAGAGWQDSTSQSVKARAIVQRDFAGLGATALQVVIVDHSRPIATDAAAQVVLTKVSKLLHGDPRISTVVAPQPGVSLSADGRTGVVTAGAAADANDMVRAADALAKPLGRLSRPGITVILTGDSALWANFNSANRSAMLRSEMLSWPVTMVILVIAFGSLVAAGLPLMLTMVGLLIAAGALVLSTHVAPVSIWALNFALMFALALGIDYALFLVVRFRAALERRGVDPGDHEGVVAAVAETVDTAGKAVAFSALTVLGSLAAILLVPSPAFRSMALGIMLSVVAVLAATLTLLPAVLGRLGTRINAGRIRVPGRSGAKSRPSLDDRLHAWGRLLWRHPVPTGLAALGVLLLAAAPVIGMRTDMPSITIVPATANARIGYDEVAKAFGPGAPGTLQVLVPASFQHAALLTLDHTAGVAAVTPGSTHAGWTLDQVVPRTGPSTPATGSTIDRIRQVLPAGSLVGGAAAENHDLQRSLSSHAAARVRAAGSDRLHLAAHRPRRPLACRRRCSHHRPVGCRSLRGGAPDLPRRTSFRTARLHTPRVRRRLGTAFLRSHGLRRGHGLHAVPPVRGQGALRDPCRPRARHGGLGAQLRARGLVGGSGHDRRVSDLRPLRATRSEGNGGYSRRGRGPRRCCRPSRPATGPAPPRPPPQLEAPTLAGTHPAPRPLRPLSAHGTCAFTDGRAPQSDSTVLRSTWD